MQCCYTWEHHSIQPLKDSEHLPYISHMQKSSIPVDSSMFRNMNACLHALHSSRGKCYNQTQHSKLLAYMNTILWSGMQVGIPSAYTILTCPKWNPLVLWYFQKRVICIHSLWSPNHLMFHISLTFSLLWPVIMLRLEVWVCFTQKMCKMILLRPIVGT